MTIAQEKLVSKSWKKGLILVILFINSVSCSEINDDQQIDNEPRKLTVSERDSILQCQLKVLKEGDTTCYIYYKAFEDTSGYQKEYLFWPLIMANNYDYKPANLHVFNELLNCYVDGNLQDFYAIDTVTRGFMLEYLNEAVKNEVPDSKRILNELNALQEKENDVESVFTNTYYSPTIENKVYFEGDTTAYNNLSIEYFGLHDELFLFWSLFMANRYDFDKAYLDVFTCIYFAAEIRMSGFRSLDEKTRNLALKYLKIAADRKVSQADLFLMEVSGS